MLQLVPLAVVSCFLTSAALANPAGPAVVRGVVTFDQAGKLLQITSSPNSIINWQGFSIGAHEITRFIQQSPASAVLNRVVTEDPSVILGALQSNGRVFLINPNGILFGAGAQIDVAGLVASSLNMSNADFRANRLRFTGVAGAGPVVNQLNSNINAAPGGGVYLVGPAVTNRGIVTSSRGEVILAAGTSVELVNPGTPNLKVEIVAPDNQALNLGTILAESGRIGIYAGLIGNSGTLRADSVVAGADGSIKLVAAKNVTLEPASLISASGDIIRVFFPNRISGGYSVNGIAGMTYDFASGSGFDVGNSPAILGRSLFIAYGSVPTPTPLPEVILVRPPGFFPADVINALEHSMEHDQLLWPNKRRFRGRALPQ